MVSDCHPDGQDSNPRCGNISEAGFDVPRLIVIARLVEDVKQQSTHSITHYQELQGPEGHIII